MTQVFPDPVGLSMTNGKPRCSERQENKWPKARLFPSFLADSTPTAPGAELALGRKDPTGS
jgi:hypothetical protein